MTSLGTTPIEQLPNSNSSSTSNPITNSITDANQIIQPQIKDEGENIQIQNYGQQLDLERKSHPGNIDYTSQLNSIINNSNNKDLTQLPSIDIPMNSLPIQQDVQIKANHIPESKNDKDYIGSILDREKIIQNTKKKENYYDNLEYIYSRLQGPLLIGYLYFIFQLPYIRNNIFTFLPALFNKDGNPNLYGYIFNSIIFALIYYLVTDGLIKNLC